MNVTEKIRLYTLFDLIEKGIISLKQAAQEANMSIEEFSNQMKLAGYN